MAGPSTRPRRRAQGRSERAGAAVPAHATELEVIDEVAGIVSSSLRIEDMYERFAPQVKRLVGFYGMSITLVDEDERSATSEYATYPMFGPLKPGERRPLEDSGTGWVVSHHRSLVEPDLAQKRLHSTDDALLKIGVRSIVRVPLMSKERAIGALALSSQDPGAFGPNEQRILERLAAQIAPAIDNARLYEEVKQALEKLRSSQEHIIQIERLRAMGELASGVAHDFNNALTAILGRTQLLINQITYEPHLKSLQLIEQAALDSAQVVRRILDFARLHSEPLFSSVDVSRLVDDVMELTRHKWWDEAQSKGQTIEVRRHTGDALSALGDYSELREVLTNLVINAYESIPADGAIDIESEGYQEHVRISVSDTGVGMSSEVMQQAFNPFFTTKESSGTGLGLSVVLGIITRHHGTIDVDSDEGAGTTITITLPVATPVEEPDEPMVAGVPESLKAANILVIEDEPLIRDTIADILSLDGHKVTLAENGEGGLSLFRKGRYDIVFTDLGMPGLTGWDVTRAIKGHRRDVPVIMVTGWGVGIDQSQVDRNGVDGVISKPFSMDKLLDLVHRLMGEKR